MALLEARGLQAQYGWTKVLHGIDFAVAGALMLRPRLLLLDEPSLGLAPLVVREILRIVRTINREERVSVLLVEQNAAVALGLADRAYLMETGRVVMSGPASELRQNDAIRRAYLGY